MLQHVHVNCLSPKELGVYTTGTSCTTTPTTSTARSGRAEPTPTLSRPKRASRIPVRGDDPRYSVSSYGPRARSERASLARVETMPDPKTYAEAMKRPDADMCDAACEEEKRSFEIMGVYDVVPRPENRKILGSKWVLRIKRGPDGTIQKYKARVVAQGFTQTEGVDYDETFAPVLRYVPYSQRPRS